VRDAGAVRKGMATHGRRPHARHTRRAKRCIQNKENEMTPHAISHLLAQRRAITEAMMRAVRVRRRVQQLYKETSNVS